jgi:hypothetical protein
MKFTTRLIHGLGQYTAYTGASLKRADEARDHIKAALLVGGGSGQVQLLYGHIVDEIWNVANGLAQPEVIGGYAAAMRKQTDKKALAGFQEGYADAEKGESE